MTMGAIYEENESDWSQNVHLNSNNCSVRDLAYMYMHHSGSKPGYRVRPGYTSVINIHKCTCSYTSI